MNFKPDSQTSNSISVPFFEDARADIAPGYATTLTEERLKTDILQTLAQLGGTDVMFQSGSFAYPVKGVLNQVRYGYLITFRAHGRPAQMQVAGLPMRVNDHEPKRGQVRRQALYVVAQQLKALLTAIVFNPGSTPLIQYVLIPGTERTVGEYVASVGSLPNMNPQLAMGEVMDAQVEVVTP